MNISTQAFPHISELSNFTSTMTSPGTKFILDLLAKSVAKINAATESSTGTRPTSKKKKRKHKTDEEIPKKKVKSKHTDYEDPELRKRETESVVKREYVEADLKIDKCAWKSEGENMTIIHESKTDNVKTETDTIELKRKKKKRHKKDKYFNKTELTDVDKRGIIHISGKTENIEFDRKNHIEIKPENCVIKAEVDNCVPVDIKTEMAWHDRHKTIHKKDVVSVKTEYVEFEDNHDHSTKGAECEIPVLKIENKSGSRTKSEPTYKTNEKTYEDVSSGKKFVLDLLAKSAEKVSATDVKEKKPKIKKAINVNSKAEKKVYIYERKLNKKLENYVSIEHIKDESKEINACKGKVRKARTSGKELRKFSPDEDKRLLQEMEEFGNNISYSKLSKELNRTNKTIRVRVEKLKTGKKM